MKIKLYCSVVQNKFSKKIFCDQILQAAAILNKQLKTLMFNFFKLNSSFFPKYFPFSTIPTSEIFKKYF